MNQLVLKKKNELMKKKKGFTLVELIIVIAIIAILAAMAIPKFSAVRTDAKVSNDVAAAKNIQSQVAVAVANNTVTVPKNLGDVDDDILSKLDGKASTGDAEAIANTKFKYLVTSNGDIEVYAGTYKLYPDNDGSNRQKYAKAAAGKTTTTP